MKEFFFRLHAVLFDIINIIYQLVKFKILSLLYYCKYGNYTYPYIEKEIGKTIYILANGPSLNSEIEELIKEDQFINSEKFVVNYFYKSQWVKKIKPAHYCIADPAFFNENIDCIDKYDLFRFFSEEINWNMNLYVPLEGLDIINKYVKNNYVHIIPIPTILYGGLNKNMFNSWKKGKSVPLFVNISIMAIFISLNQGFKDIRLYGVDHTFLNGLYVDEDNILYTNDTHFYGENKCPIMNSYGEHFLMHDWVYDKYLTFLEHHKMQKYAEFLGTRIVNCTKDSLIDAYPRLSKLKKEGKI